jgi:hypothetical protein
MAIFLAGYGLTSEALADPILPSPTVSLQAVPDDPTVNYQGPSIIYNGPMISDPACGGQYTCISNTYNTGYAWAGVYGNPTQGLTVETAGNFWALADLYYDFYLSGPTGVIVPVTFTGTFTSQGLSTGWISMGVYAINPATPSSGGYEGLVGISPETLGGGDVIPFAITANATSDVLYQVLLQGAVQSEYAGIPLYANIDSTISISPAFPDTNQFQLDLSPGIGNSSDVIPEPSSAFLLLTGLLTAVFVRCKRNAFEP